MNVQRGEKAYFYTDRGIYKFPVKEKYTGKEKLELEIPAENYIDKGEYSINYLSCYDGWKGMEFFPICTLNEKWAMDLRLYKGYKILKKIRFGRWEIKKWSTIEKLFILA